MEKEIFKDKEGKVIGEVYHTSGKDSETENFNEGSVYHMSEHDMLVEELSKLEVQILGALDEEKGNLIKQKEAIEAKLDALPEDKLAA